MSKGLLERIEDYYHLHGPVGIAAQSYGAYRTSGAVTDFVNNPVTETISKKVADFPLLDGIVYYGSRGANIARSLYELLIGATLDLGAFVARAGIAGVYDAAHYAGDIGKNLLHNPLTTEYWKTLGHAVAHYEPFMYDLHKLVSQYHVFTNNDHDPVLSPFFPGIDQAHFNAYNALIGGLVLGGTYLAARMKTRNTICPENGEIAPLPAEKVDNVLSF